MFIVIRFDPNKYGYNIAKVGFYKKSFRYLTPEALNGL